MRFFRKLLQWARSFGRILGGHFASGAILEENDKRLIQHYDSLAPHYSKLYEGNSRMTHFYNMRKRRIYELLKSVSGGSLLEVGCASGKLVDHILKKNIQYFGVDISGGMVKVSKETFPNTATAHFAVGDTRHLPFSECLFDVVLCIGMLEYVPKEEVAIKELARVLKPAGTCIISGINKWSPYNAWDRLIYRNLVRRWPAAIVHEYHSEKKYCESLTRENLTVVDVIYFDFDVFIPPLDRRFPSLAVSTSEKLEPYCRSRFRGLGNGFIMKCIKTV